MAQFWEHSVQALDGIAWGSAGGRHPRHRPHHDSRQRAARVVRALGRTRRAERQQGRQQGAVAMGAGDVAGVFGADRAWLLNKLASKLTSDGDLIVASDLTRDQGRNRVDAEAKLAALVAGRAGAPEETARDQTQPGGARHGELTRRKRGGRSRKQEERRATDSAAGLGRVGSGLWRARLDARRWTCAARARAIVLRGLAARRRAVATRSRCHTFRRTAAPAGGRSDARRPREARCSRSMFGGKPARVARHLLQQRAGEVAAARGPRATSCRFAPAASTVDALLVGAVTRQRCQAARCAAVALQASRISTRCGTPAARPMALVNTSRPMPVGRHRPRGLQGCACGRWCAGGRPSRSAAGRGRQQNWRSRISSVTRAAVASWFSSRTWRVRWS